MEVKYKHRLAFLATWYQKEATLVKRFIVCFFPLKSTVEVIDQKTQKIFLRRTKMPQLTENDFYIGSNVVIFGRQFDIVGYADEVTRKALSKNIKTFLLLKNSIISNFGDIICSLVDSKIGIRRIERVKFTAHHVRAFLKDNANVSEDQYYILKNQLLAGPSIGLELVDENIIDIMVRVVTENEECKKDRSYPRALVALFDDKDMVTGAYVSHDAQTAARDLKFFFTRKTGPERTCLMKNTTLCIIKPRLIKEKKLGIIINEITNNGFLITGIHMHFLERVQCEEFLEVYKGTVPEYVHWVEQLGSGICLALEIKCEDAEKDSWEEFRNYCGPLDPKVGKILRPKTLRAHYGIDKIMNGIHCTDLPDDTVIELQYFFKILD